MKVTGILIGFFFLMGPVIGQRAGAALDVNYYQLNLHIEPSDSSISGSIVAQFQVQDSVNTLIFHLFPELKLDSVLLDKVKVPAHREDRKILIAGSFQKGDQKVAEFYYHGKPLVAKHAPWDGGLVWGRDSLNRPFSGVACEGLGASSWWPNHDLLWDKADSIHFNFSVPKPLKVVCNGQFVGVKEEEDNRIFSYRVSNPMINYNATFYVGNFVTITDTFIGLEGILPIRYEVLDYNKEKALRHFVQVKPMLRIYEDLFGAYPFYEDGYKLVEAPYLGMEHQSAIAYGNDYLMGYRGRQISAVNFDYIIIHETGHEYWGNSISMASLSDMWIHESFCTYTEVLFVEQAYGLEERDAYLKFCAVNVKHSGPIIPTDSDQMGDGDMYHKGALLLHLMRESLQNDSLWFACLLMLNQEFRHQTVGTEELVRKINEFCAYDFSPLIFTYLKQATPPVLQIKKLSKRKYEMHWTGVEVGFAMRVFVKGVGFVFVTDHPVVVKKRRLKQDHIKNPYGMFTVNYE